MLINRTIIPGKILWREIVLVILRIFSTLIIEGVVLFKFGFKSKRSWICFIIVNLITQGILNFLLVFTSMADYIIMILFWEMCIIIFEMIVFSIVLDNEDCMKYVCIANLASIIGGGIIQYILMPI